MENLVNFFWANPVNSILYIIFAILAVATPFRQLVCVIGEKKSYAYFDTQSIVQIFIWIIIAILAIGVPIILANNYSGEGFTLNFFPKIGMFLGGIIGIIIVLFRDPEEALI